MKLQRTIWNCRCQGLLKVLVNAAINLKHHSMFYALVQLIVDEKDVDAFRKALRPDRGEVVE